MARVARLFPVERGERLIGAGNFAALGLLAASLASLAIWASAVANEPGKADESASAAEETAGSDPDLSYASAVSDRFAADIKKQNLSFVTPEILAALQAELRDDPSAAGNQAAGWRRPRKSPPSCSTNSCIGDLIGIPIRHFAIGSTS